LNSAKHIYAQAKTTSVAQLTTAVPFDFYPEGEWRDDMEFGAIQLYKATSQENYLQVTRYLELC
jgi:endoglucanase